MSEIQPISWRTVVYGTPVISVDDAAVGKVHEVLGSDGEDIFHGLRVSLASAHKDVLITADDVQSMTADQIRIGLSRADVEAMPSYDETATYHLASVGWLRKHIGWRQDSKSDEEPG